MFFVLIGWFLLSFVVARAASQRGFSGFGWFLFSISFSPLIAGFSLLLFPARPSADNRTLHGTIRSTDQLAVAVQELRGAIKDGRTELQKSPRLRYSAVDQMLSSERPSSVDSAWREAALDRQMTEAPRKRGAGSWILLIAIFGTGVALAAFGIAKLRWDVAPPSQASVKDPAILAQVEYDGKTPSTLRYVDFAITVGSEPATGGTGSVPFAKGSFKGQTISINFDGKDGGREEPHAELWLMKIDPSAAAPQVIFTYFSGGNHCCIATKIATIGAKGNWSIVDDGELDGEGYEFKDLDGDGGRELVSIDNSFLYAFCAYACSSAPTRIKKLFGSELRDVTADVRYHRFLQQRLQEMEANARPGGEKSLHSNGYLGGWVGAKALVGEFSGAWQEMLATYNRKPDWIMKACSPISLDQCLEAKKREVDFPEALAAHLVAKGYITLKEKRKLNLGKTAESVMPGPQQPGRKQHIAVPNLPTDPKSLVVEMSVTVTNENPPVIAGSTNLPNGTFLSVGMMGEPPACVPDCGRWFKDTVVQNGRFTIGTKLTGAEKLLAAFYKIDVTMMSHGQADPIVKSVIGPNGENLRGSYVVAPGNGRGASYIPIKFPRNSPPSEDERYQGLMINYTQRVFIASDAASDEAVRSRAIADSRKRALESCRIIEALRAGALTGREIDRDELKAKIDGCAAGAETKLQGALP